MNRNTWIIIIVAVIVIIGLIWIFNRGASTVAAKWLDMVPRFCPVAPTRKTRG